MEAARFFKKLIGGQRLSISGWLFLATLFFFLFFLGGLATLLGQLPAGVMARGISIGPFEIGGLTFSQAEKRLNLQVEVFEKQGIPLMYHEKLMILPSVIYSPTNPELSAVIFDFETSKAVEKAFELGRQDSRFAQFVSRLALRFYGRKLPLSFSFNEKLAQQFLKEKLSLWEKTGREASLKAVFQPASDSFLVEVIPEEAGYNFNYLFITEEIKRRLKNLELMPINLVLESFSPLLTIKEAADFKPLAEEILKRGDLNLFLAGEKRNFTPLENFSLTGFTIPAEDWSQWLKLKKDKEIFLGLDEEAAGNYLKKRISPLIESEVKEAKFEIKDGKVAVFQPAQDGLLIDEEETLKEIERAIFDPLPGSRELVMKTVQARQAVGGLNDFGIKEIIGIGQSNFRGSPPNRVHNIKVGSQTLNGLLIAPGETFSLLKALGEVDAEHGYRPELVIKGNKTIPEFGGGLCQIGTTSFRVALASGLPILERQNHSYRVSYYEPAGVDATIYNPRPDLKFLNDTGSYILIQTKIVGTELIFEFWGTKDGRQIEQSQPKIFNIKSPPSPQLIETLDLPIGKKKCTEKPHAGADAVFTYVVTYPDGAVKSEEFKSHYRPWGEVCLIGVEKLSEPAVIDGGEATSTIP